MKVNGVYVVEFFGTLAPGRVKLNREYPLVTSGNSTAVVTSVILRDIVIQSGTVIGRRVMTEQAPDFYRLVVIPQSRVRRAHQVSA